MEEVSIIGVDLAKLIFQLHGATGEGERMFREPRSTHSALRRPRPHRRPRPRVCGNSPLW